MRKIIILFFLVSTLINANGKPSDTDKQIMYLGLNYDFKRADELLNQQIRNGESLKNHFLFLNLELLKVIKATDEAPYSKRRIVRDSLNQILVKYSENVIDKYEEMELSKFDRFYLGSIYGLLGRFYGVSRSWMSAFSAGKAGKNIMENLIEEDPDFIDGYLLLGMMNYYADRLGGFTEFIAGILGLSGNRSTGIKYLKKVDEGGDINRWQATMILIELHSRMEGNKFESLPLLEKIVKEFPNNKHFVNWLCYEYINLYRFEEAERLIKKYNNSYINDYVRGLFYHQIGQYNTSNEIYDTLMTNQENTWRWVYDNAKYTQALNHLFLGNIKEAVKYSKSLNENYLEQFNEIVQNQNLYNELEKFKLSLFLNDSNLIKEFSKNKIDFKGSNLAESAINYYWGIYYFNRKQYSEAENHFLKAKGINFKDYGYSTSQYLIHIYLNKKVDKEKVKLLLDDIDELDNDGLSFFSQDLEEKYGL